MITITKPIISPEGHFQPDYQVEVSLDGIDVRKTFSPAGTKYAFSSRVTAPTLADSVTKTEIFSQGQGSRNKYFDCVRPEGQRIYDGVFLAEVLKVTDPDLALQGIQPIIPDTFSSDGFNCGYFSFVNPETGEKFDVLFDTKDRETSTEVLKDDNYFRISLYKPETSFAACSVVGYVPLEEPILGQRGNIPYLFSRLISGELVAFKPFDYFHSDFVIDGNAELVGIGTQAVRVSYPSQARMALAREFAADVDRFADKHGDELASLDGRFGQLKLAHRHPLRDLVNLREKHSEEGGNDLLNVMVNVASDVFYRELNDLNSHLRKLREELPVPEGLRRVPK
tara:strand:- start:633 stop:1649 length:1017 start_codon:yes stop_codon:yes gene_type:complete